MVCKDKESTKRRYLQSIRKKKNSIKQFNAFRPKGVPTLVREEVEKFKEQFAKEMEAKLEQRVEQEVDERVEFEVTRRLSELSLMADQNALYSDSMVVPSPPSPPPSPDNKVRQKKRSKTPTHRKKRSFKKRVDSSKRIMFPNYRTKSPFSPVGSLPPTPPPYPDSYYSD
jgi:hypothetical protein